MAARKGHPLDPLLRPRSVAVLGASGRVDSMGAWALENLRRGGFGGEIFPVNPRHDTVAGLHCYRKLGELPTTPDLLIFAVSDEHVEALLDEAIALKVPAAVIMSSLASGRDEVPPLKDRVQQKLAGSGMLLCGANGMGFYNVRDHVWACGFDSAWHMAPGNVSLISHSGSGMSGLIDSDERLEINVAVSTGNELGVSMDRYLDFVLDLPETRAVGLFIETARNPEGFRAALQKACDKNIPVVALKVGRTEQAARLTVSHSGAMAGDSATYEALFAHYGVHAVRDMDELATLLILFAQLHPLGPGGLVSLHDSGGERQLMIDLADEAAVPLTDLQPATVAALQGVLDPELPAVNPLDAWSRGGPGAGQQMTDCLSLMMQDPGAALGVVAHDRAPGGVIYKSYIGYMERAAAASGKPVALVAARQGSGADPVAVSATRRGFPVLDGVPVFLRGVRALFAQRDFQPDRLAATTPPAGAVHSLRQRLENQGALDEQASLEALADFGINANPGRRVEDLRALQNAAKQFGFPLVAKTAAPGISHKSDRRGVHLDLGDMRALESAFEDLVSRCGPIVLVSPMVGPGVEMILGSRYDPQFGPVVILGMGGIYAEHLGDAVTALPPFSTDRARRAIAGLRLRALLDGVRGGAPADVAGYCEMAARFSVMVSELGASLTEADINPVIVSEDGAIAVDALLVGSAKEN